MDRVAIKIQDLEMRYNDFIIQENLNFEINSGEIFVIMGDSGSGKSTLLRHLIGLQSPTKGKVLYGATDFWNLTPSERQFVVRRFGVLYQRGALWSSMTLAENIALPMREYTEYSDNDVSELVSFKLSLVGLGGYEDYYPAEISGGMRKRASFARAMALDPEILFFDEPSAGLDPPTSRRLDELIMEIRDSLAATIIIVTHELASIFAIADNAIFVDAESKTQIAIGPPREMCEYSENSKVRDFLLRGKGESVTRKANI